MRFERYVAALDRDGLRAAAGALLRLLDGGDGAGDGRRLPPEFAGSEDAPAAVGGPAGTATRRRTGESAPGTLRRSAPGPAALPERSAADAPPEITEEPEPPREEPEALLPAARRGAPASWQAAARIQTEPARPRSASAAVGPDRDMDAISEFFRRDSHRYDTGFGE